MRKIKEVLRLKWEQGLTDRTIARSVSIARSTVGEYLRRATDAGLGWPLPAELDEAEVKRRLFPPAPDVPTGSRLLPNRTEIHGELKRKGVTLFLLWEEYRQANPKGYQYSWFCEQYRRWTGKLDLVMRQEHRAGEKLFVGVSGYVVVRFVAGDDGPDPFAAGRLSGLGRGTAMLEIDDRRIKLGCVMPGEAPAIFGDALRRVSAAATFLYQDSVRYWYSTQPTVTKLADDRAEQLKGDPDAVAGEVGR